MAKAARAAIQAGNHRLAVKNLEAALEVQPNDPVEMELMPRTKAAALRQEAEALTLHGEFSEVGALLEQAEKIEPKNPVTKGLGGSNSCVVRKNRPIPI